MQRADHALRTAKLVAAQDGRSSGGVLAAKAWAARSKRKVQQEHAGALMAALADNDADVCRQAVAGLERLDAEVLEEHASTLIGALAHPLAEVRQAAMEALTGLATNRVGSPAKEEQACSMQEAVAGMLGPRGSQLLAAPVA